MGPAVTGSKEYENKKMMLASHKALFGGLTRQLIHLVSIHFLEGLPGVPVIHY